MVQETRNVVEWLKRWFYDTNTVDGKVSNLQGQINNKASQTDLNTTNSNVTALQSAVDGKVDKVTGKGLSTNDYTTTEKNKLANIQAQANKTIVDTELDNSSTNPVENQVITNAFENLRIKVVDELPNPPSSEYSDDVYISMNNWTGGLYVCRYVSKENGELLGYGEWEWVQLDRGLSFDAVYPVGSIYMSVNSTSPSTLFGGTWQQLEDTFLYATSGTADTGYQATDGEATHTLSINEMPSHAHKPHDWTIIVSNGANSGNYSNPSGKFFKIFKDDANQNRTTGYTGGGQAHNNMPPYMKVYMWKRTA